MRYERRQPARALGWHLSLPQRGRLVLHFAAPAPITAGLLVGNVSLLAQGDRDALLRQEQSRAGADDPPANNDDIDAGGQGLIGRD
jgi:hypothetical protein